MSAPTVSPHDIDQRTSAVRWRPPLDTEALGELLTKLRSWQPLDDDALLDDVADALDDIPPDEAGTAELVQRLGGHITRLTEIAVAASADQRDVYTAGLVQRGRVLRSQDVPDDRASATHHVRRLGWVANELLTMTVAVAELLANRPGFQNVRARWSPYRDTCHVVEWGEPPPEYDDVARGRFYGYREAAIPELFAARGAPHNHCSSGDRSMELDACGTSCGDGWCT